MFEKLAQTDYDDIYIRIKEGSYLSFLAIEYPDVWKRICQEDLNSAAARAKGDPQFRYRKELDLDKIVTRLLQAAKKRR